LIPLNEYSGRRELGGTSKRARLLAGLLKPMRRINDFSKSLPVWLRRYLFALSLLTLGTVLAAFLLNAFGAKTTVFVSLIGDVVFLACAWLGYGEGLLAGILITFLIPRLLLPGTPLHADIPRFALLLVLSMLVSSISAFKRKAERALKFTAEELESRVQARTLELQKNEQRLSEKARLLDLAPVGVLSTDGNDVIRYWSQGAAQMYGWTSQEAVGQTSRQLLGFAVSMEDVMTALAATGVWEAELTHSRKDGSEITVATRWASQTQADGKLSGFLQINADVTERKRALEQIQASELRFRQLADSMPQIVWTAAQDGLVEYLNQRWHEFTGLDVSDHLTEDIHSIIHPDSLAQFVSSWETAVRAKEPYESEVRFLHGGTGEYRWFLCRAVPVRDSGVSSVRWFGTFTDIHEQKRIEAAFRRASADLSRFAYSTDHDLQEPLRNVSTYSQLLETRYGNRLDAEVTSFIRFISRDAKRMCALITNLTIYTSAGGASELAHTPSDSDTAINKALANLQDVIAESQAVVVYKDLPRVGLPEDDLRQVFQSLIENAIQYRKADIAPRVEVTALRKSAEWIFSVQDNGIGIPAEYTQQIFGVFQRLHGAGPYGSIGMGLAICQKIVEHYGGCIWVDSQLGVGSIFRFSVPVAPALETLSEQYRIQKTPDVQSNC
jgi:PAS domain S-box-containing protein